MTCLEIARIHYRAVLANSRLERDSVAMRAWVCADIAREQKRKSVVKALKALDMLSAHRITPDTMSAHFMLLQCQARGWF